MHEGYGTHTKGLICHDPSLGLSTKSRACKGAGCEVTFRPSTPGSTRWLCRSTFATNEGKNASIILNARLRL
jgi:hypothetical protein